MTTYMCPRGQSSQVSLPSSNSPTSQASEMKTIKNIYYILTYVLRKIVLLGTSIKDINIRGARGLPKADTCRWGGKRGVKRQR